MAYTFALKSRTLADTARLDRPQANAPNSEQSMTPDAKRILAAFILAALLGLAVIGVPLPRDTFSVAALWSLAFIAVGGLFGFLFGIPRVLQGDNPAPTNTAAPTTPSTSTATASSTQTAPLDPSSRSISLRRKDTKRLLSTAKNMSVNAAGNKSRVALPLILRMPTGSNTNTCLSIQEAKRI